MLLLNEPSDPTLRLDMAPALNWLSRRAVSGAVHAGALNIEPITTGAFLRETSTMNAPAALSSITCALCGKQVHPNALAHPKLSHRPSNSGTWSVFKPNASQPSMPSGASTSAASVPSRPSSRNSNPAYQSQIFVFRVTAASAPGSSGQKSTTYALCGTGWCLPRLRATCALWHFLRTRVVEHIWEEEMPVHAMSPPTTPSKPSRSNSASISNFAGAIAGSIANGVSTVSGGRKGAGEAPPVPPRRQSSGRVGSLLGMLGTGGNKAPPPPPKASGAPLTPTREKPSLMSRSPPGSGARSPTGTVASRRRASNASNGSIKSPVRSPVVPAVTVHRKTPSGTRDKAEQNIEHHIDEHGPPAEVLFELDAGADGPKSPVGNSPTKDVPTLAPPAIPPRARPVSASVVPLPMSPPTTPEPVSAEAAQAPATAVPPRAQSPALNGRASPALNVNGRASPALNGRGSPAPPPVPKRAAGRKRAATIMREAAQTPPPEKKAEAAIVEEEEPAAAPAEPASASAAVAPTDAAPAATEDSPAPKDEAPPPASSETVLPGGEAAPGPADEPAPAEPTLVGTPALEIADAPAESLATTPTQPSPSPVPAIETPAQPAHSDTELPAPAQTLSIENLVAPTPSSPGGESPLLSASSPVYEREPEPEPAQEETKEDVPAPASELDSGAQYVGETTWEERAWKEIVTLREEMFWARIGCVR